MFVQCTVLKMSLLQTKVKEGAGNVFSVPTPDRRVINSTSKSYKLASRREVVGEGCQTISTQFKFLRQ